ncbi:MAG: hypothetical protein Q7T49_03050 [bacterium]|nr:hypothetical protein [bacterium]
MNTPTIKQEISLLRSAVISLIGKDSEGTYRPEFVRSTLAALNRKPTNNFKTTASFLKDISQL